ncbi:MAG: hypothetical protein KC657_11905 [Myxococcales bacterium]|nr:hypothetical protein [Myxococcales bacterium]
MDTWQLAVAGSAALFTGFMLWRMRPVVSSEGRATKGRLAEAKARVDKAADDAERAVALTDAAEATARLGKAGSAVALYLRAFRAAPASSAVVESAAASLAKRPRALEDLLWRKLGSDAWTDANRAATRAALVALADVYDKRQRTKVRAEAIRHALSLMGE